MLHPSPSWKLTQDAECSAYAVSSLYEDKHGEFGSQTAFGGNQ